MIRNILQKKRAGGSSEDESLLSMQCSLVSDVGSAAMQQVIQDLKDTMKHQPLSVGLAAPQIGETIAIAVVKTSDGPLVLVNPVVLGSSGKKDRKRESCMSLFGWTGEVERREKIAVRYEDEQGVPQQRNFRSFEARIVAHELDHLSGRTYDSLVFGGLKPTDLFDGHSPTPPV